MDKSAKSDSPVRFALCRLQLRREPGYARRFLRVHPLQGYMYVIDEDDLTGISDGIRVFRPIFNRDGHYVDRFLKISWWEYQGKAYTTNNLYHQTQWEFENHLDRPLEKWEMEFLRKVRRHKSLGKEVDLLLQRSAHWWQLHELRIGSRARPR